MSRTGPAVNGIVGLLAALAVLVFALGSALAATADAKTPAGLFAVDDPFPVGVAPTDVNLMRKANVRSAHTGIFWPRVEPLDGTFNWISTDKLVGDFAAKGIHVVPYVYGSARYAADNFYKPPLRSPAAQQAWQHFLRKLVNRYGPGGKYWTDPSLYHLRHPRAKPVPITTWQVWHEPNLTKYFLPSVSPSRYAKLLRISHDAIKQADPHAKILLAGLPAYAKLTAWGFLKQLYKEKGIKRDFDGVAIHPYAPTVALQARALKQLRRVIVKHHDKRTPIWITELGWGSRPPDQYGLNKGVAGQARYLKKSFRMVLHHRRRWNIKRVFWFRWRDPIQDRCFGSIGCSAGLVGKNGDPKPAWKAFRQFTKR
jgi:hypothetical protein